MAGREVEQRHIDILCRVKDAVTVPVAVKLGPHFSSVDEIALRLDQAGADGSPFCATICAPPSPRPPASKNQPTWSSTSWRAPTW
jgi:dihydroorotate dehydrogenase